MTTDQDSGQSRPKRTRRQVEKFDAPPATDDSVKRRRLNSTKAASTSSTAAPVAAPTSRTASSKPNTTTQRRGAKGKPVGKDSRDTKSAYDRLPGSSEDENRKNEPSVRRPAIKYKKLGLRVPKSPPIPISKGVYEPPDSDDELTVEKPVNDPKDAQQSASTRGRAGNAGKAAPKPSRSRRVATATEKKVDQGIVTDNKSKRRGRPPKTQEPLEEHATREDPTNARLTKSVVGSPSRQVAGLKGILTPQKTKQPGRARKNVAFGDEKHTEVYFEDLPSKQKSSEKSKKSGRTQAQEERVPEDTTGDDDENEDEEVCAICLKPDSEPPNEIVFCENCDMAVHQKCYNVPVIPEGDWFCKNCSQEDVLSGSKPVISATKKPSKSITADIPDIPNFGQHLRTMQRILLDRCTGNRRIKLQGQGDAYEKAFQLVEQTVLAGEGNSMMVIGARGCGKTAMVETIISELASEHRDEFHVIRLNGFVHTDDKLALKDIWRQMGREMDLEDDPSNKTSNYADTMASLLALLSHPSEITAAEEGVTSKSVVFVIDEFDLFATHARQTLLYNLFDIAQARKAPIAVLGLTTRIDVVESLEKRVKSRFSHRYVYLSVPKTLQAYWDICRQGLVVDEEDLSLEGFDTRLKGLSEFHGYWAKKIEALRKTPAFEKHLEYLYYTSKSVPAFLTSCILPLSALSAASLELKFTAPLAEYAPLEPLDSKVHLLAALSDLEMALLISAARLDIVAHTDTVNFAMAYDEYTSQMGKQRVQSSASGGTGPLALGAAGRTWGRATAVVAWERLVFLGLLVPAGIGGRGSAAHAGLEGKMWKLDVSLEEIPPAVDLPGFLAKWCAQI